MMAATLKRISCLNELTHLLIEFVASSFLLRPHLLLVVVDKNDVLHVLQICPFSTPLPRNVAIAPLLGLVVDLWLL